MKSFKYVLIFLVSFSFGFLVWSVLNLFLFGYPKFNESVKSDFSIFNINLKRIFSNEKSPSASSASLDYTLKAVYKNKNEGFVILSKNNKNYFVDLNGTINGYKLVNITQTGAVFKKGSKFYTVSFKNLKPATTSYRSEPKVFSIERNELEKYKRDFSKIWKEIGIIKTKEGYLITYVKPKSVFEKIGLKKGDIILEINGIELKSDKDAWRAYNSVDKYDFVNLKIKRKNRIKVLHYEIN